MDGTLFPRGMIREGSYQLPVLGSGPALTYHSGNAYTNQNGTQAFATFTPTGFTKPNKDAAPGLQTNPIAQGHEGVQMILDILNGGLFDFLPSEDTERELRKRFATPLAVGYSIGRNKREYFTIPLFGPTGKPVELGENIMIRGYNALDSKITLEGVVKIHSGMVVNRHLASGNAVLKDIDTLPQRASAAYHRSIHALFEKTGKQYAKDLQRMQTDFGF